MSTTHSAHTYVVILLTSKIDAVVGNDKHEEDVSSNQ